MLTEPSLIDPPGSESKNIMNRAELPVILLIPFSLLTVGTCRAQEAPVTLIEVTASKQPVAVLEAVLQSRLKGVAIYRVRACNAGSLDAEVRVGRILSVIERQVPVIDAALIQATLAAGRRKSKLYRANAVAEYALLLAGLLTGGGTIAAKPAIQAGISAATILSHKWGTDLADRQAPPGLFETLKENEMANILAGDCFGGIILGGYRPGLETAAGQLVTAGAERAIPRRPEMRR